MSEPEYSVEFDRMGGYDCLSAAYRVRKGDRILARLDLADYTTAPEGSREAVEAQLEAEKNAQLFAASQDLLEAVRFLRKWVRLPDGIDSEEWCRQFNKASEAMDRAEGKGTAETARKGN